MRVGLISDIHGNLISLEAVLKDIEREGVDLLICLGDVATLGPQPREVVERIQELECEFIMGNHDTYVINPHHLQFYMNEEWFIHTVEWCISQLDDSHIQFLRSFQPHFQLTFDNETNLICYHGSPRSDTDLILATTPKEELEEMLDGYKATVMAGGHTHVQMMRQYQGRMVVNVGSVGMPFKKNPFEKGPYVLPWAEYAIIECAHGTLNVSLHRVNIDLTLVKQTALSSRLPAPDEWVRNWGSKKELW